MITYQTANLLLRRPNNQVDPSIISLQQIQVLISILESVIQNNIPGDVVEFGCYIGESSKYIRMMLDHHRSNKDFYVYDSFEGLPSLSVYEENTGWKAGTLKTSADVLEANFLNNGLRPPIIHKDWFKNIPSDKIPSIISFGFLDGDFYDSIYDSLTQVYDRLSIGGVLVFHDYERPDLPGVKAAVDTFISAKGLSTSNYLQFKVFHELGVLIKTA